MRFILQVITALSAQLAKAMRTQARSVLTPELMDYLSRSARQMAKVLALRLFLAFASFSGFILAFTEAMRLLDSVGSIMGTAMLLGSLALCLISAILFFAIGHKVPKFQTTHTNLQETVTPEQEHIRPDLMQLDDGLAVLMNELREERERFRDSRPSK